MYLHPLSETCLECLCTCILQSSLLLRTRAMRNKQQKFTLADDTIALFGRIYSNNSNIFVEYIRTNIFANIRPNIFELFEYSGKWKLALFVLFEYSGKYKLVLFVLFEYSANPYSSHLYFLNQYNEAV